MATQSKDKIALAQAILTALKNAPEGLRCHSIQFAVAYTAPGIDNSGRALDRALQYLRKSGQISYARGRWFMCPALTPSANENDASAKDEG